jgi:hypothetical protein
MLDAREEAVSAAVARARMTHGAGMIAPRLEKPAFSDKSHTHGGGRGEVARMDGVKERREFS